VTGNKSSRGFLPKPSHRPYNLGGIPSLARLLEYLCSKVEMLTWARSAG